MQSKNQKDRANKKLLKSPLAFKKLIIIIMLLLILLVLGITAWLVIDLIFIPIKTTSIKKDHALFKLAEEQYQKGYLANSALTYQNFINTNPAKQEKILAYKHLFEIAVLNQEIEKALLYLKEIELLDKNRPDIYLSRIKLFIRQNQLLSASREIELNQSKLKGSIEFKEIRAILDLKQGQIEPALEKLTQIPFRKREFSTHKLIVQSYIKNRQYSSAVKYLKKIEKKIKHSDNRMKQMEFQLLNTIALLFSGKMADLKKTSRPRYQKGSYEKINFKLYLYSLIVQDDLKTISQVIEKSPHYFENDPDFNQIIGDYYLYKQSYSKALAFYETIKQLRNYHYQELLTLCDLYHLTGDYQKSIETMKFLSLNHGYKTDIFYKNMAVNYQSLQDYSSALFFLKEGMLQYPEDIDFYVRIAHLYLVINDPEKAMQTIGQGKAALNQSNRHSYDHRLDQLQLLAYQKNNQVIKENYLLELRDKKPDHIDHYFRLLEYYLKKNKLVDTKREFDTLLNLPLNQKQQAFIHIYQYIYSLKKNDPFLYQQMAEKINLLKGSSFDFNRINKAVIMIKANQFDEALNELSILENSLPGKALLKLIYYLKSVIYYYQADFPELNYYLNKTIQIDPHFNKALFLKQLKQ